MTEFLFRSDSYLRTAPARVESLLPDGGIVLDRTIFYASSGGQPGDIGVLEAADGRRIAIAATVHPEGDKTRIAHVPAEGGGPLSPGDEVTAVLDWDRRHRLMRMHTALHLLSVVFPFPVTGGSIGAEEGRLDFDIDGEVPPKEEIEARLNALVAADHPVTQEWITDDELLAGPALVKTMKVKPPIGTGRVRLIRIGDIDLQPCGGTHVRSTAEIGRLVIGKMESKGKQNRRVRIRFAE